ncbi:hypothetical protein [Streptomyces sp. NPDC052496]|uniref:hypothetical protein n=1 Tax=Streptomyces sp. NPDC052496 TaxID=3154951 RepID=UPI003428BA45
MRSFTPRLAYYVLKSRAYHAVLRAPRFRTAKSAPAATEHRPDRPQRCSLDRPPRMFPDRPQRSAPDRPHRRTKALAG